jgi:hypothetical protein
MKLRKFKTNKLFYSKFPYKIVLYCRGAHLVSFIGSEKLSKMTSELAKSYGITDISEFNDFINIMKTILKDSEIKCRLERHTISIFFNDVSFYDNLYDSISLWLKEFHAPSSMEELNFLTNNASKKIICNKLPYDKYQFKVTIKSSMDPNLRQSFKIWADKYGEKFKFANHTLEWIKTGSKGYGWNPMVHVSDPAVLSLVVLFLSGNVSKVYEFVPRSNINTSLDQEQSCRHLVKI